jgi:hypothetical protein
MSPSPQAKKIMILTAENKRTQKIVRKARQKLAQMNEKEHDSFTANVDHSRVFGGDLHGTRVVFNECIKQAAAAKKTVKMAMR